MIKSLFLFILLYSTINAQVTNSFLKRSNSQFVNNDGVFYLKGVNLGNWLHLEPYMINAPVSVSGSHELLTQAIAGITNNPSFPSTFFTTWYSTFIQQKDIDTIANMGFNHVRIPFPYHLFYDVNAQITINDGFVYLDSAVAWCKQNNMYAILDLHLAPGGQNDGDLWSSYASNKLITQQIWTAIAQHYSNETAVGGYDILNEPVISNASEQWKLKDLYQSITASIRSVDTNHLLFFEGNWYASSFWELTDGTASENDRWDNNMALSQHVYWVPQPSSTNYWTNSIANGMNVPLWCGEGGENSNHWLNDWVDDCATMNSSWCLWTYKKAGGISSIFSNPFNSTYQSLLNYWNGGTQPSSVDAMNGLLQFAQETDLMYCTFKKDVKDAVLRPSYSVSPLPFKQHILPCSINAVDYDLGANGVGSYDSVYQSIGQGSNFTTYNNGWNYRNDGVDIETWTGSPTIGSIEPGEWLNYTVQVPQAAFYKVSLQYAAPSSGAKVKIQSGGVDIIQEQLLPATNSWGSWEFANLGIIPIVAQTDFSFKLVFNMNGLNVKALQFELIDSFNLSIQLPIKDNVLLVDLNGQLKVTSTKEIQSIAFHASDGKSISINQQKMNRFCTVLKVNDLTGYFFLKITHSDGTEVWKKILLT
jgi:hypothetical protein